LFHSRGQHPGGGGGRRVSGACFGCRFGLLGIFGPVFFGRDFFGGGAGGAAPNVTGHPGPEGGGPPQIVCLGDDFAAVGAALPPPRPDWAVGQSRKSQARGFFFEKSLCFWEKLGSARGAFKTFDKRPFFFFTRGFTPPGGGQAHVSALVWGGNCCGTMGPPRGGVPGPGGPTVTTPRRGGLLQAF